MNIKLIEQWELRLYWPLAKPFIEKAIPYGDGKYCIDTVYNSLYNMDSQLWIVYENVKVVAAITTCIFNYPRSKRLIIEFCGGEDIKSWLNVLDDLREFGKSHGCEKMEIIGRPGWEKILPFKKIQTIFVEGM
jgi:hypothetical protein